MGCQTTKNDNGEDEIFHTGPLIRRDLVNKPLIFQKHFEFEVVSSNLLTYNPWITSPSKISIAD